MLVFKCKMCGGDLEIEGQGSICVCTHCGSRMTLPRLSDERRANLYDRANHFRRNNEFDKAMSLYERISLEDPEDAEAYWSILLCRYGIEYVEDPKSGQRIPTCNRTQKTSILADADYKKALECADENARGLYEEEARRIDEIVRGILNISEQEEPFDVFICYKETDHTGRRTPDSVLGQELYFQLTKMDFKVFFSRITLEDKLGSEYEPYIFAALGSAKVMVALGTKPDYFQAPWVRNEWTRYLSLIRQGERKTLIPAYRDMDPYDLPEEFSHLQAQDMGKLGFLQDLSRGIRKIVQDGSEPPRQTATPQVVVQPVVGSVDSLLDRAFLNLEYKDWAKADEVLEQALNLDPRNAKAYVGKLMAHLQIAFEEEMAASPQPLEPLINYQKAVRFADEEYRAVLEGYNQAILDRLEQQEKEAIYSRALSIMQERRSVPAMQNAIGLFQQIISFRDAEQMIEECNSIIQQIEEAAQFRKEAERFRQEQEEMLLAAKQEEERIKAQEWQEWVASFDQQVKKVICSFIALLLITTVVAYIGIQSKDTIKTHRLYNSAILYLDSGDFSKAIESLSELSKAEGYENILPETLYQYGVDFIEEGRLDEGIYLLYQIPNYKKTNEWVFEGAYRKAQKFVEEGNLHRAADWYARVSGYKSADTKMRNVCDQLVADAMEQKQYSLAFSYLSRMKYMKEIPDAMRQLHPLIHPITASKDGIIRIVEGNTVIANGSLQDEVLEWTDIVALDSGGDHIVGLRADGSVLAAGSNMQGQCDVEDWEEVVSVYAKPGCTVGLRADGTLLVAGAYWSGKDLDMQPAMDVAYNSSTLAILTRYGTMHYHTRYSEEYIISEWERIIQLAATKDNIYGLDTDGFVLTDQADDNTDEGRLRDFRDIISISSSNHIVAGLSKDRTVVTTDEALNKLVVDWSDVIAITTANGYFGETFLFALCEDGTMLSAGTARDNMFAPQELTLLDIVSYSYQDQTVFAG